MTTAPRGGSFLPAWSHKYLSKATKEWFRQSVRTLSPGFSCLFFLFPLEHSMTDRVPDWRWEWTESVESRCGTLTDLYPIISDKICRCLNRAVIHILYSCVDIPSSCRSASPSVHIELIMCTYDCIGASSLCSHCLAHSWRPTVITCQSAPQLLHITRLPTVEAAARRKNLPSAAAPRRGEENCTNSTRWLVSRIYCLPINRNPNHTVSVFTLQTPHGSCQRVIY